MNFKKLKQLRLKRGYRLTDMAQKTGYTASFLSQVERGLKQPSLEALRKISECLDVPIIRVLIEDDNETIPVEENPTDDDMCIVIHKNNRNNFDLNGLSKSELLTPSLLDSQKKPEIVGLYVETNPGCWTSEKMVFHDYEESIFVIKGKMQANVGNNIYTLEEGDSLFIRRNIPHNLFNSGKEVLILACYFSTNIF